MPAIPQNLLDHLESTLNTQFSDTHRVSGGSINRAARLTSEKTGRCFLKWNQSDDPDMFKKEVRGLQLLASGDTELFIPEVIDHGELDDPSTGYLLMDYIEEGSPGQNAAHHFGRELARMHRNQADQHGLDHDNYIGRLPQSNSRHDRWVDFFIEERIEYQFQIARERDALPAGLHQYFKNMYKQLPDLMPDEPPSLLHGDLWGGNYTYHTSGVAAIYDPAAYYGSREMELSFTHMFGGFPGAFYEGYESEWPLEPNFSERIELYNLYHLMTHTNMFGGHYARQVERIVRQF